MSAAGNEGSMFFKVDSLCKEVEEIQIDVKGIKGEQDDHKIQLQIIKEQVKQLQDNGIRLENVVMSENRETRLTITQTNGELHKVINQLIGYKSGENELAHNVTMATNESRHNLRMKTLESIAKIILTLCGSGGIIYLIFFQ